MRVRASMAVMVLAVLLASAVVVEAATVVYVHSTKAKIYAENSLGSKLVSTAAQGEELEVLEQKSNWYQVRYKGNSGWVSSLLVKASPPMGRVSALQKSKADISKESRRRASVVTLTAAARGLAEDDRRRLGGLTTMDYDSLERVEAISGNISEDEVSAFIEEIK